MPAILSSPLFWGIVALVAVAAYLVGRRSNSKGQVLDQGHGAPMQPVRKSEATKTVQKPARQAQCPVPVQPSVASRPALAAVKTWGYQLQNLDIAMAAASPFDLLVVDYTKSGSEETRLTIAEIERMKRKPDGGRRIVLAYVSIGEAESYRPYWEASWKTNKPQWLLRENPDWEENYAVCFWDAGWQELMCGSPGAYLDRIQAQGFDGFYLDKCDVFEDLEMHEKRIAATRPNIKRDMVEFVKLIAGHVKARDPNFLIIMQNAETLLEHADLMAVIDGVAKEELIYGIDVVEKKNAVDEIEYAKSCLDLAKRAGKAVFVVEYLNARDKIAKAAALIEGWGYVLYIAPKDRDLKRLNYDVLEA